MPDLVEHICGGTCEIRMSQAEKARCQDFCAEAGDPPCWRLPAMTSDWPKNAPVHPCLECSDANNA